MSQKKLPKKKKKTFKKVYKFVSGFIQSHPGLHVAHRPWIRPAFTRE